MPTSPFLAAETEVMSSGSEVPNATTVKATISGSMPIRLTETVLAAFTTSVAPPTTIARPTMLITIKNHTLASSPSYPLLSRAIIPVPTVLPLSASATA